MTVEYEIYLGYAIILAALLIRWYFLYDLFYKGKSKDRLIALFQLGPNAHASMNGFDAVFYKYELTKNFMKMFGLIFSLGGSLLMAAILADKFHIPYLWYVVLGINLLNIRLSSYFWKKGEAKLLMDIEALVAKEPSFLDRVVIKYQSMSPAAKFFDGFKSQKDLY